ncbi:MAG: SDR family oxidoreductase [Pseudomonadota bacterium]|nr:SDR family oxidoreductase [Pseudomonadota bacterium]
MGEAATDTRRELAGKVVLVTGGARNIGRAIATALAAAGAGVMVNARSSIAAAGETVALITEAGGRAESFVTDITEPRGVEALVAATVERFGRLDVLVHNAAVRAEQPFDSISFEQWRHILAVILDGAFLSAQACLPHLRQSDSASIVHIGGETGHAGASHRAHVVAAKAGLAGFTKGLALDLAPDRITVNCVVPGRIGTVRGMPGAPEQPAHRRAPPPIGRLGLPEEVAAMVRMLCGPDARFVTGQSIHVNGGGLMP